MPTNQYELIPNDITSETTSLTSSESDVDDDEEGSQSPVTANRDRIARAESQLRRDPRFNQPPPSALKRAGLVVFIIFLFWLTFQVRKLRAAPKSNVVHATRYSKEFKFRPAASPIITETLVDGRVKIRGALSTPTPLPSPKTTKKGRRTKRKGTKSHRKTKKSSRN